MISTRILQDDRVTFLKLPAEIRNRISQYALSSDKALALVLPLEAVPKIAMRPLSALVTSRLVAKRPTLVDPNNILESNDIVEFNQLKFVCRQLFFETAGLELKFNNLHIVGEDRVGAQFFQFAKYTIARAHWLTGITITIERLHNWDILRQEEPPRAGGLLETPGMLYKIYGWCKVHPSIKVDIVCAQLETRILYRHDRLFFHLIGSIAMLAAVFRGEEFRAALPPQASNTVSRNITFLRDHCPSGMEETSPRATNLRFRTVKKSLDAATEAAIRSKMATLTTGYPYWKHIMEDHWLPLLKLWVEEGI